jgi:hypothetical protein
MVTRLHDLLFHLLMLTLVVLLAWLSGHFAQNWDWTRHGSNSLNPVSINTLERIPGAISVVAYTPENTTLRDHIRRFVARYQQLKPTITLEFVDPLRNPDAARRQGISLSGELLLRYGEREERLQQLDEERFTNAILRLVRKDERWVASLRGHGERDLLGKSNFDLGDFGLSLSQKGYQVVGFDLVTSPTPPDNTAVLIIASPERPFLEGEIERLKDYLERGGNLLLLSDPELPVAASLVTRLTGIEQLKGTIVDANVRELGIDNPAVALTAAYPDHPATHEFKLLSLFPQAAALVPPADAIGWQMTPLLQTQAHSWNETGPLSGEIERNPLEGEQAGPLTIGYALSRQSKQGEQRLIVIGDGDFLANSYLANAGNLDLGLALMRWLSGNDPMIGIPAPRADDMELHLSKPAIALIGLGSLIVAPLLLLAMGLIMAWRRSRA